MTSRLLPIVVLCVATAGAVASCYADPINSPPVDVSIDVPSPIGRGQQALFKTSARDPDGDALTYTWASGPGPCDVALPAPGIPGFNPLYQVLIIGDADGKACVTLTVTDAHGATTTAPPQTVTIENLPPVARIVVQQPSATNRLGEYDLYSSFRLSAATSSDPDADSLLPTWSWAPPSPPNGAPKESVALVPCAPPIPSQPDLPKNLAICFGPVTLPGLYQVALVVDDGHATSPPTQIGLTVSPDRAPCITATDPAAPTARLVWDPAVSKSFAVLRVDDDGDAFPSAGPLPFGSPIFSWSLSRNAGSWQPIAGFDTLTEVTLPGGNFASGDQIAVRVEVRDRQPAHNLTGCGDTDVCPVACPQRITWRVDYQ